MLFQSGNPRAPLKDASVPGAPHLNNLPANGQHLVAQSTVAPASRYRGPLNFPRSIGSISFGVIPLCGSGAAISAGCCPTRLVKIKIVRETPIPAAVRFCNLPSQWGAAVAGYECRRPPTNVGSRLIILIEGNEAHLSPRNFLPTQSILRFDTS